jgi:hypothetical protein
MGRTAWHSVCPGCGTEESTEHVAVQMLRFADSTDQIESHEYSVCPTCFARQQREFYTKGKEWTLSKIPREAVRG